MSKYTKVARGLCDLLIWAALSGASLLLHKLVHPFRRGFFCGDESLNYPLRESTVGHELVIGISLGVPTAVIVVVEMFKQLPGGRLTQRLGQLYRQALCYLYGLAMCTFATMLSKLCIGRLRPHFFAVCQPMLPDGSGCQDAQNIGRYIDSFTCSNANMSEFTFKQLNQSFPSGHASIMMYAMLYLAIYMQVAISTRISKLVKHLLQFLFVMFGWYVSLTRITDYYHHWSDVLAGGLLGVAVACLTAVYVTDLFAGRRFGPRTGYSANTLRKPQVSPKSSAKAQPGGSTVSAAPGAAIPPTLPVYTFGTLPYLSAHPAQAQYAQTYHNYGYVP